MGVQRGSVLKETTPVSYTIFGEKCSYAHRQVDEQPSKRSKKNGDKSAVVMLKKYDLHDRNGNMLSTVTKFTRDWGNPL